MVVIWMVVFLIGTENPKEYYYWSATETPNSWQSAGTLQG